MLPRIMNWTQTAGRWMRMRMRMSRPVAVYDEDTTDLADVVKSEAWKEKFNLNDDAFLNDNYNDFVNQFRQGGKNDLEKKNKRNPGNTP